MNQQSTLRALLKCQKINKRRRKDEIKTFRLLDKNLKDLQGNKRFTQGSANTTFATESMKAHIDGRTAPQIDFKCDINKANTLSNINARIPPRPQDSTQQNGLPLLATIRKEDRHKQCERNLLNQIESQDSPSESVQIPIDQAFDSEKAKKLEGNHRIRFNKKLSHNKQPIHKDEGIFTDPNIIDQNNEDSKQKQSVYLMNASTAQQSAPRKIKGVKCLDRVTHFKQMTNEQKLKSSQKTSATINPQNANLDHNQQYQQQLENESKIQQFIKDQVGMTASSQQQLLQDKQQPTSQMSQTGSIQEEISMIKRKRGRPPTKKTGTQINNDPLKQQTPQVKLEEPDLIKNDLSIKQGDKICRLVSTGPSTEKHDSEEKALQSKEPIKQTSNESSRASKPEEEVKGDSGENHFCARDRGQIQQLQLVLNKKPLNSNTSPIQDQKNDKTFQNALDPNLQDQRMINPSLSTFNDSNQQQDKGFKLSNLTQTGQNGYPSYAESKQGLPPPLKRQKVDQYYNCKSPDHSFNQEDQHYMRDYQRAQLMDNHAIFLDPSGLYKSEGHAYSPTMRQRINSFHQDNYMGYSGRDQIFYHNQPNNGSMISPKFQPPPQQMNAQDHKFFNPEFLDQGYYGSMMSPRVQEIVRDQHQQEYYENN